MRSSAAFGVRRAAEEQQSQPAWCACVSVVPCDLPCLVICRIVLQRPSSLASGCLPSLSDPAACVLVV
jgi:hypothetical protein